MRASHRWLMELTGLDLSPEQVQERLTAAGLEVEPPEPRGTGLEGVVIADVVGVVPHPERDKLKLVTVYDGRARFQVVCGAPNVPAPPARVVLARPGTVLPGGLQVAERKVAGIPSPGMICSEAELDIGSDDSGILVLEDDQVAEPGTPVGKALGLEDAVHAIDVLPNRPDCLGHVGIARELAALHERSFAVKPPPCPSDLVVAPSELYPQKEHTFSLLKLQGHGTPRIDPTGARGLGPVRVDIEAPDRCPRYGAALVTGVNIGPSPFWLRYRLHVLGLRAINNVVDITNLILMQFGHPIHAFDHDKLSESRIVVRLARAGERIVTIDDQQRQLVDDDLLICDGSGPVALAGVMGGADSEVSEATKRVLIECAYFDPRSVRRTARRTGLHTDSSHRFERGVDPGAVRQVLAHTVSMMVQLCGGAAVPEALDVAPKPHEARRIELRPERLQGLMGMAYERSQAAETLRRLGCEVAGESGGAWQVTAPSFRPDLQREVDLIEEIARVRGYDALPTVLPRVRPSEQGTPRMLQFLRRLREASAAAGFREAVNYAFVSPQRARAARSPEPAVQLANPLSEDRAVMRRSLLPGLAANLRTAQHQQLKRVALFELARVFAPGGRGQLPHEHHELGILLWGERRSWYAEEGKLDFYDAKGCVQHIVRAALGERVETRLAEDLAREAPHLHPRRAASIRVAEQGVGYVGELHPEVVEALELEGRPVFASLDVESLARFEPSRGRQAQQLPRFPAVTRDLAVVVAEEVPVGAVQAVVREAAGELAEAVTLFDLYRGEPVPPGKKSVALRVVYRDPATTLTDKRVEKIHQKAVRAAQDRFGADLRQ